MHAGINDNPKDPEIVTVACAESAGVGGSAWRPRRTVKPRAVKMQQAIVDVASSSIRASMWCQS